MESAALLIVLDGFAALLMAGVAAYFLRLWTGTRHPLHLLFSLGLALVAVTFTTVSASVLDLGRSPEIWDALRICGQLGGALIVFFAYVGARTRGAPSPFVAIGFALLGLTVLFAALYLVIPPAFQVPTTRTAFIVAHSATGAAWLGCAVMAIRGAPITTRSRLLAPAGFLAFAVSKYSWLLVDISEDPRLVPFVYPWRFAGILLILAAVALPRKPEAAT